MLAWGIAPGIEIAAQTALKARFNLEVDHGATYEQTGAGTESGFQR